MQSQGCLRGGRPERQRRDAGSPGGGRWLAFKVEEGRQGREVGSPQSPQKKQGPADTSTSARWDLQNRKVMNYCHLTPPRLWSNHGDLRVVWRLG